MSSADEIAVKLRNAYALTGLIFNALNSHRALPCAIADAPSGHGIFELFKPCKGARTSAGQRPAY
jgi:hypothetical protein